MTTTIHPGQLVGEERTIWQPGFWMANIWLLFLVFPVLSIVYADDLSSLRTGVGLVVLGVFAATHALGYRVLIRRELGLLDAPTSTGWRRLTDPNRSELWFALLVALLAIGFAVAGWGLLGAIPFIITFAIFNLSWRAAGITFVTCVAFVVIGPLVIGEFGQWWFLLAIILTASAPTALGRLAEERSHDVNALQTQLMLSEERARLARDVHDVLGHSLTAIVLKTQVTDRMLAAIDDPIPEVAAARQQLAETQDVSRKALAEIRATVSGLRSTDLGDELAAARSVLSDAGVSLVVQGEPSSVPHRHHTALGWAVREAVTNIVRHAEASRCTIELGGDQGFLVVCDDGIGITDGREGNGLTGLRERLAGDQLQLRIPDGPTGTTLVVTSADG